ncbi:hypothetical protein DSO57_1000677 [Entomophthora muscae]|uniref:Uncharacterized protein n=1 Tax=Entomophthora muscae TaxID=34485 RepID=A0ACC2TWQ4_9FUNG|nr:hypothetical protein DSO57_1000677 [Entomophthora muscae]
MTTQPIPIPPKKDDQAQLSPISSLTSPPSVIQGSHMSHPETSRLAQKWGFGVRTSTYPQPIKRSSSPMQSMIFEGQLFY